MGVIILLSTLLVLKKWQGKNVVLEKRWKRWIVGIEILGCLISGMDYLMANPFFSGKLKRPQIGQEATTETMEVTFQNQKQKVSVPVSGKKMTDEEVRHCLKKAKKEINQTFCKKNVSLNAIRGNVHVQDTYADGLVNARWSFSDPDKIRQDGTIKRSHIQRKTLVYATVELSCQKQCDVYMFAFQVLPPQLNTPDGFQYYLKKALKEADEQDSQKEDMYLPDKVKSIPLRWNKKQDARGDELAALGALGGLVLLLGKKEEERRKKKQRDRCMEMDYPDIVSKLSIYLGAGSSLRNAMEKIAQNYLGQIKNERSKQRPGFEEVVRTCREIQDGMGEMEAYERFGQRCAHKSYRKLSILLIQNIKKGNRGLIEQLEREEREAFEARKMLARTIGEETSTKLLLPMMGLLGMILVILIMPALMGMEL